MIRYDHLIGRSFAWGTADCLALFRDLYFDNWGISVTNYARPTNWQSDKIDLIRACYAREGFKLFAPDNIDLRPGDVACVAIGASKPNHFAVYIGDNRIVHHKANTFSNIETFRDYWRNQTSFYLRHPDVPDMTPQYPDVDFGDLLRESRTFKPVEG